VLALKTPRAVALAAVAGLVTVGVAVSFLESYRALYWWCQRHAVHGAWAVAWPVQIDAFVMVGELALFVALVDGWQLKHRVLPWAITAAGLTVSVAGNVGHVATHDVFTRLTAAVPPLTAYVMLAAGLGLLKRVVANQPQAARKKPGPKPGSRRAPKVRDVELSPAGLTALTAEPTVPLFDPHASMSFPRVGADGMPVKPQQVLV
jgi:hypothetical protein